MKYNGKILRRAKELLDEENDRHERQFQIRREELYLRQPRLREIDRILHMTSYRVLSVALRQGRDPLPDIQKLQNENLSLQKERGDILRDMGYREDYLTPSPRCPLCRDSGYRDSVPCRCLLEYYKREQQRELSQIMPMGNQSFETFRLDYYSNQIDPVLKTSPRQNMERVLRICQTFARQFDPEISGNLFLVGATGLGKTFLSASIARVVSAAGWSVFHDTAIRVFPRLEAERFTRQEEEENSDISRILKCDLLILDDLGTESATNYTLSSLYLIINTRLLERRATILNSNVIMKNFRQRYTPQVISRIEGEYQILPFFGEDIREIKKKEREKSRSSNLT